MASAGGGNIYPYPYKIMFNTVIEALIESGFKILVIDEFYGIIRAKTKISFKSWGEVIVANLVRTPHGIQIVITSHAHQLYDWGKSKENIDKFFNILNYKVMSMR